MPFSTLGFAVSGSDPSQHPTILLVQRGPSDLAGCIQLYWFVSCHASAIVLANATVSAGQPTSAGDYTLAGAGQSGGTWHEVFSMDVPSGDGRLQSPTLASFSSLALPHNQITDRYGIAGNYLVVSGRTLAREVAGVTRGSARRPIANESRSAVRASRRKLAGMAGDSVDRERW